MCVCKFEAEISSVDQMHESVMLLKSGLNEVLRQTSKVVFVIINMTGWEPEEVKDSLGLWLLINCLTRHSL